MALNRILRTGLVGLAAGFSVSCAADVSVDLPLVTAPRLLAVQANPPEARPGETVELRSLYVGPNGPLDLGGDFFRWWTCRARRPPASLGAVASECLQIHQFAGNPDVLVELGDGLAIDARLETGVCSRFGPDPAISADGSASRPVDADSTGGYYQPVVLSSNGSAVHIAQIRIRCGLAGATQAQTAAFNRVRANNENPRITSLGWDGADPIVETGEGSVDGQETASVARGSTITLRAAWPVCPHAPDCELESCQPLAPCEGEETYLWLDPLDGSLQFRVETLRVSWFSTVGRIDPVASSTTESDLPQSASTTWELPAGFTGQAHVWAVLRDDRGGVGWRQLKVDVQ